MHDLTLTSFSEIWRVLPDAVVASSSVKVADSCGQRRKDHQASAGLLGVAPALAAEAADQRPFGSDRRLVERAYRAFNEAFGNARAVAALHAERAFLLPPTHDIIRGRTDVQVQASPVTSRPAPRRSSTAGCRAPSA
jgi:hypothetical protein